MFVNRRSSELGYTRATVRNGPIQTRIPLYSVIKHDSMQNAGRSSTNKNTIHNTHIKSIDAVITSYTFMTMRSFHKRYLPEKIDGDMVLNHNMSDNR